jgi:glycogen synthase
MMNVLHLVHHSLPHQDGYSLRTHCIARGLAALGYGSLVATLPGIQLRLGGGEGVAATAETAVIDGIRYCHCHAPAGPSAASGLVVRFCRAVLRVAPAGVVCRVRDVYYRQSAVRPSAQSRFGGAAGYYRACVERNHPLLLHAHTPFLNAQHAAALREQYHLPYLYEVRGLWEDTYVSSEGWRDGAGAYQVRRSAETQAMGQADAVVAISSALRGELAGRGVPEDRLFVVPNGVHAAAFQPLPPDPELVLRYGLTDKVVVGYVSSLRELEGLDLLLAAMADVLRTEGQVACLIVGDGPERARLGALADRLGLGQRVIFTGRVPHHDVQRFYSLLDVFVVPRIDLRVNHVVTPLKPFEAMAMEKPVLASDVGGLAEIVRNGETGLLFRAGDRADLAAKIVGLVRQPELRARLGRMARQWVVGERDWPVLVRRYGAIYSALLEGGNGRAGCLPRRPA